MKKRPLVGIGTDTTMKFGRELMRGVLRYANARRHWLVHEEMRVNQPTLPNWPQCDGAILAGAEPEVLALIRRQCRHLVICSGNYNPADQPIVCADSAAIGRMAAEHLADCGLRYFAFYGRSGEAVAERRYTGFKKALEARGYSAAVSPVTWPATYYWVGRSHWPALTSWITALPKPVGIFAQDDMAAHDLAALCEARAIAVPDTVAIIGANNDDLLCESAWPPLSSVRVDFSQVGYLAARQLDRMLSGEPIPAAERWLEVAPAGVAARQSTAVLAVDEPHVATAIAYIRDHACDPCSVDKVVAQAPVNRRWLERKFMQKLGRTIHGQITQARMEMAIRLLGDSDDTLEQISSRCGYTEVQHFCRAFRQNQGVPPGAFRRSQRERA